MNHFLNGLLSSACVILLLTGCVTSTTPPIEASTGTAPAATKVSDPTNTVPGRAAPLMDNTAPAGMALIPAGAFTIGDTLDDEADALPTNVAVSAFYMDTNLVSYILWQSVYNTATNNGYGFFQGDGGGTYAASGKNANYPVYTVDWYDCVKWCNARSQQAGLTPVYYTDAGLKQIFTNGDSPTDIYPNWSANGYRLPTEAEWEKAARGGLTGQRFPWGDTISEGQANYNSDTNFSYDMGPKGYNPIGAAGGYPTTSPIGSFPANGYGLYDMAGNLTEWCWDWHVSPPYPNGSPYLGGNDPHGPEYGGGLRELRGGNFNDSAANARCAFREGYFPGSVGWDIGFRCVRSH